tara:strand:- start:48 stop:800 length:753 start_codon:yes stop_codon:yes gene_type:complete
MIYDTEALILSRYSYGDTSLICNLFTAEYGRLSIIAKGARKIKSPYNAILRPLQFIDLHYYYKSKRNIQLLKEATLNQHFFETHNNYSKIIASYQLLDIINQICKIDNPNKIIFRLTKKILNKINIKDSKHIMTYKIFFKLQLLNYIGYQPMIDFCNTCNKKLVDGKFQWEIGQLVCLDCKSNDSKNIDLIIDQRNLNLIRYLSNTHIDEINTEISNSNYNLEVINKYLLYFLSFHIINLKYLKSFKLAI